MTNVPTDPEPRAVYDVAIVGGGCIGCSTAYHLARASDLDVCVIEKEYHLALHQSGRNSGVLHPGFNYTPSSIKARFSVEGTERLKAFASDHAIPLEEFGVVVVAQDAAEEARLETLQAQAEANGVDTELIDERQLADHEPHVDGRAALYCPEAASIDSQKYVYALASETERAGVDFFLGHRFETVHDTGTALDVETSKGTIRTDYLVNAAGLYADHIAHQFGVGHGYQVIPFRGEYFELVPAKRHLCRTMVYPVPDPEVPFLGVHYTRRTDEKVIVGPNAVLAFGREAYKNTQADIGETIDALTFPGFWKLFSNPTMAKAAWNEMNKSYRKSRFVDDAKRLIPEVEASDLRRSFAGIRAQLMSEDGELVNDPMFETGPSSLHVLNAVSPGLTSSLPLGEHLAETVRRDLGA